MASFRIIRVAEGEARQHAFCCSACMPQVGKEPSFDTYNRLEISKDNNAGACASCEGTGFNTKGEHCRRCHGSGICQNCGGKAMREWRELPGSIRKRFGSIGEVLEARARTYTARAKFYRDY